MALSVRAHMREADVIKAVRTTGGLSSKPTPLELAVEERVGYPVRITDEGIKRKWIVVRARK